jgi:hyperosmotically inducible periplasmic protein
MARRTTLPFVIAASLLLLTVSAPAGLAQDLTPGPTWSQEDTLRIVKDVQKKLGGLTNYSVFDWITFATQGKTVILKGYASRPTLKAEAERSLKNVSGIESVVNEIEVLPLSPNDDRIRASVYSRIYTQPGLSKYNANAGNIRRATGPGPNIAAMAGGITQSPPIGYHAIHIIVKNGHVTLYGVVLNQSDAAIAGMQANSAPGAFSVDNDLVVQSSASKSK